MTLRQAQGEKDIELTTRRSVDNYIQYSGRPFTIRDVVAMTELNEYTVANYIRHLKDQGTIKVVGKDVGGYKLYIKVSKKRKRKKKPEPEPTDEEYEAALDWGFAQGIL